MQSKLPGHGRGEAKQLMLWIKELVPISRCSSLLDLNDGVVWCRLMGKLRPGTLASVLIINRPANVNDSMHNYMLLESAFSKANIPWNFETRKLIAGDCHELLKMAKHFAQLRDAPDAPQSEEPTKSVPLKSSRQTRCLAGKLDSQQLSSSRRSSPGASTVKLQDAVQPQTANTEQQSVVNDQLQLRQQIQTLLHKQQEAMAAFLAGNLPHNPAHPFAAPTTCFCSKCLSQKEEEAAAEQ